MAGRNVVMQTPDAKLQAYRCILTHIDSYGFRGVCVCYNNCGAGLRGLQASAGAIFHLKKAFSMQKIGFVFPADALEREIRKDRDCSAGKGTLKIRCCTFSR